MDYFSLKGQTAVITGGASGLGLAITQCLVKAGAKVVVLGSRSVELGKEALADLGDSVEYRVYDVKATSSAQALANDIIATHGAISILVNNAGNHCKKPIEEMTVEDFESVLDVHLVGAFALTKAFVPHMKTNGSGSIIFQASMSSYIGVPNVAGYAAAKAGYLGLVRTLASECGESGVRVNAIAPGWIDTPMFRKATDTDPARLAKINGRIPMKRIGKPEDIGMAAVFLCSEAAAYITGTCLPVDGGALIGF